MPFCGSCGAKIGETDQFCWSCGAEVQYSDFAILSTGSAATATSVEVADKGNLNNGVAEEVQYNAPITWDENDAQYGTPVESGSSASEMLSKATDAASDVLKKASGAVDQAKIVIGDIASGVITEQSRAKSASAQSTPAPAVIENRHSDMQQYMSKKDLWTWLKKEDRRKLFYLEDREAPSQEEYMQLVSSKIDGNGVPASVVHRSLRWDMSDVQSEEYLVQPFTKAVNPLTCCIRFAQVGKFCFVEQKTFLAPPKLPARPGKKRNVPDTSKEKQAMLIGALLFGAGLLMMMSSCSVSRSQYSSSPDGTLSLAGVVCALFGGLMFAWGYTNGNIKDILEHNKKVEEETRLWNEAWDNWENSVFVHSFQEASNGQVTRVYQAVFDCMRQVNDDIFGDTASSEEKEDNSMNDLREQIAHRKETYR